MEFTLVDYNLVKPVCLVLQTVITGNTFSGSLQNLQGINKNILFLEAMRITPFPQQRAGY